MALKMKWKNRREEKRREHIKSKCLDHKTRIELLSLYFSVSVCICRHHCISWNHKRIEKPSSDIHICDANPFSSITPRHFFSTQSHCISHRIQYWLDSFSTIQFSLFFFFFTLHISTNKVFSIMLLHADDFNAVHFVLPWYLFFTTCFCTSILNVFMSYSPSLSFFVLLFRHCRARHLHWCAHSKHFYRFSPTFFSGSYFFLWLLYVSE